jgi:hypothetical protein
MTSFNEISIKHNTDKGSSSPSGGHYYSEFYDRWFSPIKEKVTDICEIGVWNGCSLRAFEEYFPNANILGIDLEDKSYLNNDRIQTIQLDQGNSSQLDATLQFLNLQNRQFDFILDDGSHDVEHQQLTFGKFFPLVKSGGVYIIEDLGTSYFNLGQNLYGYQTTQTKINNNTIQFLNQRPFNSLWINEENINYINKHVDYVITFSKTNNLPYSYQFSCINNYPIQSITSIIVKK